MQFKTPESALHAMSQESATMAKPKGPFAHSSGRDFSKPPMSATPVDALPDASHSILEKGRDLIDRVRGSATATDSYVRAQPWKAIGIGAAIGVLLGLVFARRA